MELAVVLLGQDQPGRGHERRPVPIAALLVVVVPVTELTRLGVAGCDQVTAGRGASRPAGRGGAALREDQDGEQKTYETLQRLGHGVLLGGDTGGTRLQQMVSGVA